MDTQKKPAWATAQSNQVDAVMQVPDRPLKVELEAVQAFIPDADRSISNPAIEAQP